MKEYGTKELIRILKESFIAPLQDGAEKELLRRIQLGEEYEKAFNALINDEPLDGQYIHTVTCNAGRHQPVGNPGCSCGIGRRIKDTKWELEKLCHRLVEMGTISRWKCASILKINLADMDEWEESFKLRYKYTSNAEKEKDNGRESKENE